MLRTGLALGLFLAYALPAVAQDRVRLIYPAHTTVVSQTTVTQTLQDEPLEAPPLQVPEIDGMGPPPVYPMPHDSQWQEEEDGLAPGVSVLEVRSWPPPHQDWGPPPDFDQLDANGDGEISPDEASDYPLLANDFIYAAGNRSGISRARYAWWASQPK